MKRRAVWEPELRDEVLYSLIDFFISVFHTIMHRSGDYSPDSFITTRKLDMEVQMSFIPTVAQYIQDVTKKLLSLLITNQLEGVEMHLLEGKDVRERYVINFFGKLWIDSIFGENDDETSASMKIEVMKLTLRKALTALIKLPKPLKSRLFSASNLSNARFRIRLGITEECFNAKPRGPFQDDPDSDLFPWKKASHHLYKEYVEKKLSTVAITIDDTCPPGTGSCQMDVPTNHIDEGQDREKSDSNRLESTDPSSPDLFKELEKPVISPQIKDPLKTKTVEDLIRSVESEVPTLIPIDSFIYFDTLVVNMYGLIYARKILRDQDIIRRRITGSFRTHDLNSPRNYRTSSKSQAKTPQKSSEQGYESSPRSSIRPDRVDLEPSAYHRPIHSSSRSRPPAQYLQSAPVSPSTQTYSAESGHSPTVARNVSSGRSRMTARRRLL